MILGPELIAVGHDSESRRHEAQALADRLGLTVWQDGGSLPAYLLSYSDERLELRQTGRKAPGPIFVDFVGGQVAHRRQFGGGRGQPMARAIGIKGEQPPSIIDATAGLGKDSFVFASLGCHVRMMERSPIVAALLADGLERAAHSPELADILPRLQLLPGNAIEQLGGLEEDQRPDVVYLDPMYPHRQKSALVKKEMRAFRDLVGDDPDTAELLKAALGCARKRVVVKRPKGAPCLDDRKPSMDISSKNTRWDVYVSAS